MIASPVRFSVSVLVAVFVVVGGGAGASRAAGPAKPAVQPLVVADAQVRVLPRSANGRDYQIYVALPSSYGTQPARRYPVLYACDGYWDFNLLKGFYGNLVYDKAVPELIIVGLGYPGENPDYERLRRHDYTPVPDPATDRDGKTSGHAGAFLGVLENEIIPFVEREYRGDPAHRALAGSSLGGLFTLYAMLDRPGLFEAYIAPSPAADWAKDWLFRREAEFAAQHKDLPVRLFVSGAGQESPTFLAAIRRFSDQLQARRYPGLRYKWRLVDGERHAGTKAESYNRGVRFAFAPLAPNPSEK